MRRRKLWSRGPFVECDPSFRVSFRGYSSTVHLGSVIRASPALRLSRSVNQVVEDRAIANREEIVERGGVRRRRVKEICGLVSVNGGDSILGRRRKEEEQRD